MSVALPSSATVAPSDTVRSAPALATGATLSVTVIVTSSAVEALPLASVTVSVKVRSVSTETSGAVNVGRTVVAPVRVTLGTMGGGFRPGDWRGTNGWSFWAQAQVSVSCSGSELLLPSRITVLLSGALRSGPALAVGARLFVAMTTVTTTVSVAVSPPGSVTVNENVRSASFVSPVGAVKLGAAVFAPLSVTLGVPPLWVQAYVRVCFSGSALPLPSSVALAPTSARRSWPASAVGAVLAPTAMSKVRVAVSPSLSVTV